MVAVLRPAFAARGMELVEIDWRAPFEHFYEMTAALIGTPWDYQNHEREFISRLEGLDYADIPVFNDWATVTWNADKRYLNDLAARGVTIIPTLWHSDPTREDALAALDHFRVDSVVVKRQIGAGALGQHRFSRENSPPRGWRMGYPAMIQPFLPAIAEEGEMSLIFIDGVFSHSLRKRSATGDYRVQSLFGGREESWTPSSGELDQASAVLTASGDPAPLYARIDMVRLPSGELAVMEAEMIEPYLYPDHGPELGERLAEAVSARLT